MGLSMPRGHIAFESSLGHRRSSLPLEAGRSICWVAEQLGHANLSG